MGKIDNIALVGFMGSGKSTIGRLLSRETGLPLIDLDQRVESSMEYSISELWRKQGEQAFRVLERTELIRLANAETPHLLATGGGTPTFYDNMSFLKRSYVTIWLKISFETALLRSEADTINQRPLLTRNDLENLFEQRKRYYSLAEYAVDAEGPPSAVLSAIIGLLSK